MKCIKCGKKTKGEQVFCDKCLQVMENYPVKPDVHIQLPNRASPSAQKKCGKKRRNPTEEEQLAYLRRAVRVMAAVIAGLAILLGVACGMLFGGNGEKEETSLGKDYTYVSSVD